MSQKNKKQIFALVGDSITYGHGCEDHSYPAYFK